MEKRKWLWKRKSSEKSSGETESSGSVSSHSERFSDEQQEALKESPDDIAQTQSPEVSSKAKPRTEGLDESPLKTEDVDDSLRILTDRLSAALVNVSVKEDLVKQHAKVAEEAVAGWEKAENEVAVLKQQLEAAIGQKSGLEDRVSHLDGALKECVRQLRQARDDQELKIHEAISAKTLEWESTKCILEGRLIDFQNKVDFSALIDPDVCVKIEFLEKENTALRLEIHDQMEELEVRTIERDLSTQAAESASKQHLDSIKKVAKLEAECRRLKAMALKSNPSIDRKSTTASSIYSESFTDSYSDSGNKIHPNSSVEINLMDDFLEMERLVALPPANSEVCDESKSRESALRAELEATVHRTAQLERKLETLEIEKSQLEACASRNDTTVLRTELEARILQTTELGERLARLEREKEEIEKRTRSKLNEASVLIAELEEKLKNLEIEKAEMENESRDGASSLRNELKLMTRRAAELEVELTKVKAEKAELEGKSIIVESVLKSELEATIHRATELEAKLEKFETEKAELEATISRTAELEEKFKKLESENARLENESPKLEAMIHEMAPLQEKIEKLETARTELEEKLEKLESEKADLEIEKAELEASESKHGESVLRTELAMIHQTAELEEKLEKLEAEKAEIEDAFEKSQDRSEGLQLRVMETELKMDILQRELKIAKDSKQEIESQLVGLETEFRIMSEKASLMEEQARRERELSEEIGARCRELEDELSMEKDQTVSSNPPEKKVKEEDLAVAAGKLAECQKTIASLGNQLKSLATLEDFLIDTVKTPEFSRVTATDPSTGDQWRMHSNQTFSPKRDFGSPVLSVESSFIRSPSKSRDENASPASASSTSASVLSSGVSAEKNRNGFAKFFSRTKSGIRLEI